MVTEEKPPEIDPDSENLEEQHEPWIKLSELIATGEEEQVSEYLDGLTPAETALSVSRITIEEQTALVDIVNAHDAAEILEELPQEFAADILEAIPAGTGAEILHEMLTEDQADFLGEINQEAAEAILSEMPRAAAKVARDLMEYDSDCAGGLMTADLVKFRDTMTVEEVTENLRENRDKYSDYEVQYAYIVGRRGELRGVLRLRDLMLSRKQTPVSDLMIADPLSIKALDPLDVLVQFFQEHHFLGVPVVDANGVLVGVLEESAVSAATERRAKNMFLKISGIIGGEELRNLPLKIRCLRRLSWLGPNILLNVLAASVIAGYQDTIAAVTVLAVFLPIISDMSGCSGNQAVAVSIRELSLGLIRPNEVMRVFVKEGSLGLINGITLGIVLAMVAGFWQGNIHLALVVGGSLALNTMISVLLGGLVPLVLKGFKVDPALASGPILTTVTDMCGFFLVLSFASQMLDKLV